MWVRRSLVRHTSSESHWRSVSSLGDACPRMVVFEGKGSCTALDFLQGHDAVFMIWIPDGPIPRGGHWPRKGYGDVRPWRPPFFTPLLPLARVPFQAKESAHKTPFWENLEILASTASIFTQILAHKPPNLEIFSSQAPKFGNFQLTSPLIKLHLFTASIDVPAQQVKHFISFAWNLLDVTGPVNKVFTDLHPEVWMVTNTL